MKTRKTFWTIASLSLVICGMVFFLYVKPTLPARKIEYMVTGVKTGDIESTISSTGTLEAINTIQVGTQISGTIGKIYVDYNDRVKAGQLLAEIDLRLLNASLTNAKANLAVVNTRLKQVAEDFERNKALYEKKVITEKEYKDSQYAYEQTLSNKIAAEAGVKSAEVSLGYPYIKIHLVSPYLVE